MEGPQDKRPIKTIKHLSFRIRNANGANKHEELLKLQLFVQAELAAKKIRDDADIAAHKPYVRPEPVRIPVYRDENERKPGVEVPEDQIFQVVTFNGSLARLKCMRNPVATPSPPQTPPPQLPPPIPMPEEGNSSQLGSLGQLEPPNMFFSEVEAPKKVLLQMTAPRLVLLQVRTAKVAAPKKGFAQQGATIAMNNSWFVQLQKGPPKTVLLQARAPPNEQPSTQPAEPKLVPLMIIPPKIVRPQADVPKGLPSQQGSQEGTLKTRNLVLIQVKTPPQEALPPQGELPQEAPQPVADDDKPPIEKVVIRLIDNVNAVRSSSSIMKQHDYALPSTSGRMAKEELDDIHANFQYEERNWRNQATYKVTDIRKRKRLELERLQAERQRPQYRILRPVITRRAKETVITSDVSSSSDSKMPRRSFNQNWNNGSACSAIDPVSSSSSGCYCKIAIFEGAKRMVNAYEKKKLRERFNGSDTDDSD